VLITKTWPNDAHEGCVGDIDSFMIDFLIREKDLIDKNEVRIEEEGFFDDYVLGSISINFRR
jgi:hypothetical protein